MTSSLAAEASDDTACAPRFAALVRCVGLSAPGGPPPLPVLRADDSIFFSHLPMKPPPPTGLVNRSGSSLSSTSPSSRSANSCRRWLRGTCPVFSCPVCLAAREDAASTLLARMTPNSGGGSSIAALPDAKLSDPVGELLRLATSGAPPQGHPPRRPA